jgi:hypothetical protein
MFICLATRLDFFKKILINFNTCVISFKFHIRWIEIVVYNQSVSAGVIMWIWCNLKFLL